MARRMRSKTFRDSASQRRYAPNVEALNWLVDELRAEHGNGNVPYVDPDCGGVHADVLLLYQDPGPKASGPDGASGFLSYENDDPSAENLNRLLHKAELPWSRCVPWNTVPWYINRAGASHEIAKALPVLHRVRSLLPNLRVVALMGSSAQGAWAKYAGHYGTDGRDLEVVPCCHTSTRGLTSGSRRPKAEGEAQVLGAFQTIRQKVAP
jgi:hypothetical protein